MYGIYKSRINHFPPSGEKDRGDSFSFFPFCSFSFENKFLGDDSILYVIYSSDPFRYKLQTFLTHSMAVYHVIFIFIFCSLLSTGREIDEGFCTTAKHNATQSNLGRRFFQRMIDDENSYLDVNERNMCALMHFLFQEARQNRRSIRFLSGLIDFYQNQFVYNLFHRYVCAIRSNGTILQSINDGENISRT